MNEKEITLSFDLEQVANDILTKCNLISQSIRDEALADIRANVQEPDNPETRSIINRAVTEAFGRIKVACQRYLKTGRTSDNNQLERMVTGVTYTTRPITDSQNRTVYIVTSEGAFVEAYWDGTNWKAETDDRVLTPDTGTTPRTATETTDEIDSLTFETVTLTLYIPNFNVSVTAALEADCHKLIVDYATGAFLQDQVADKAAEYMGLALGQDYDNIVKDLNARDRFNMRKPSWI